MRIRSMQEEKKGGGLFGTVKSLLGGGNGNETQVCWLTLLAHFAIGLCAECAAHSEQCLPIRY